MASELAINYKMLYRKVQSLTGLAPINLMQQYRLDRAIDLLRIGQSVTQTAGLIAFKTSCPKSLSLLPSNLSPLMHPNG
ncbi:helix-turn-helix domain-containing protein [Spirosoma agri]|uniref:helix-turn-helix domain-containing protein n=1 Tax=Spirosoma agri TaxID=1987381 RepID=UPI00374462FD